MKEPKDKQVKLKDAADWTLKWRTKHPDLCTAFSIPISDLVDVLKEIGVIQAAGKTGLYTVQDENNPNGVRAYMAIDPALEHDPKKGNGEKLLIVGTKAVYDSKSGEVKQRDIINGKIDNKGIPFHPLDTGFGEDDIDTGIYDFTEPCPNLCDDESPLNGGG